MRNQTTDTLGSSLTLAYKKSGLTVTAFLDHLIATRDVFDITRSRAANSEGTMFHTAINGAICTFYFADSQWFCKQ